MTFQTTRPLSTRDDTSYHNAGRDVVLLTTSALLTSVAHFLSNKAQSAGRLQPSPDVSSKGVGNQRIDDRLRQSNIPTPMDLCLKGARDAEDRTPNDPGANCKRTLCGAACRTHELQEGAYAKRSTSKTVLAGLAVADRTTTHGALPYA